MRKYFMIGTVMAAMVLTVGCGNGKKEEATTAAATTVAETTVEETTTATETTAVEEATTKAKKKTKKKADKGETAIMKKNKEETHVLHFFSFVSIIYWHIFATIWLITLPSALPLNAGITVFII